MTVMDNIDILKLEGISTQGAPKILSELGILEKKNSKIKHLSGGQKQRVAIARALVKEPEIILADEPTGNLDIETSRHIVELLRDISSRGTAVVMTTHNLQLLQEYPGIVYRCDKHQIEDVTGEYNVIAQEASFQPENS